MVLAVPTPTTRAAGTRLTGAIWQSDVTDTATFLLNPPRFAGTQTVAQSIPAGTWTPLLLDTEQADEYNGHSTSSNTSRWVCPTGADGWYAVNGVAAFVPNASGFRAARIQVSGTAAPGLTVYLPTNGSAESVVVTPTRDILVTAGQYVEVAGWQNSGGALSTTTTLQSALWLRFSHAV